MVLYSKKNGSFQNELLIMSLKNERVAVEV